MAWRIERFLVRGEIDNRIRDRITGRLWFLGRNDPIELELYGNARRDLAGKRLEFSNPKPNLGLPENFSSQQIGVVSEITASRKVRVPDIQLDDDPQHGQYRATVSWHGGNAIYLEWFSLASGRVIVQSTDFALMLDPDSCWEMSAEEEKLQRLANARAIELFNREIEFLSANDEVPDRIDEADLAPDFKAPDLFPDDERTFAFDGYGEDESQEGLKDEIDRRENVEEDAFDETMSEELPAARDLADAEKPLFPLVEKARDLTVRVLSEVERNRWAPAAPCMHPVIDLVSAITKAGGKIAGALSVAGWPPTIEECAESLAALKQAGTFLNSAVIAADFCGEANLIPQPWLHTLEAELKSLRADTDEVIDDLRERLMRGFD